MLNVTGYIFSVIGIIATAHILLERLFKYSLFTTFIEFTPVFLRSLPTEPLPAWLGRISKDNFYHAWDVFLIYFVLVTFALFLMVAFWIFLILHILNVFYTPIYLLIALLILNIVANFTSARMQTVLKFRIKYPNLVNDEEIKKQMFSEPFCVLKTAIKFFFLDFVTGPYTSIRVLLLLILVIILYWPAWVIRIFKKNKLDLSNETTRTNYFIGYAFIFLLIGTSVTAFL